MILQIEDFNHSSHEDESIEVEIIEDESSCPDLESETSHDVYDQEFRRPGPSNLPSPMPSPKTPSRIRKIVPSFFIQSSTNSEDSESISTNHSRKRKGSTTEDNW